MGTDCVWTKKKRGSLQLYHVESNDRSPKDYFTVRNR